MKDKVSTALDCLGMKIAVFGMSCIEIILDISGRNEYNFTQRLCLRDI